MISKDWIRCATANSVSYHLKDEAFSLGIDFKKGVGFEIRILGSAALITDELLVSLREDLLMLEGLGDVEE